ncbi:MAG: hypothetical protein WCC08_03700, partial [Terrimicrobiaceae bacterium]
MPAPTRDALNKVATSHRPPAGTTARPHDDAPHTARRRPSARTTTRPHDGKSAHPHGFGCEAPCFVGLLAAAHRVDDGRVVGRGEHRIGAECVDGEVDRAWARGFLSDLGPMPNANGRIGEREKGASEKRR